MKRNAIRAGCAALALAAATLLSGCATPLGQEYGTAGGIGGAIIGGATGGVRGAVVGGAAGAIVGGVVGDQQSYREGDPGYRRPPHCFDERVPVYDNWGNFRGYQWRRVCR
jgi:uncharacterized protein YcfJ